MRMTRRTGFTVIEVLMALAILATLLTAVAVAFDASVKNYHDNEALYKTLNTARAALLRITNDVRTAQAVATAGPDPGEDPDTSQCSMITANGSDLTYRYDGAADTLYLTDNVTGASYVLCENVTAMTFERREADKVTDSGMLRVVCNVRITMTVTDDGGKMPQTLAAAAVVRRNL